MSFYISTNKLAATFSGSTQPTGATVDDLWNDSGNLQYYDGAAWQSAGSSGSSGGLPVSTSGNSLVLGVGCFAIGRPDDGIQYDIGDTTAALYSTSAASSSAGYVRNGSSGTFTTSAEPVTGTWAAVSPARVDPFASNAGYAGLWIRTA